MKRYALFVCEQEAANGGWADFRQAYDDLAVAQIAGMYWVEDMEDVSFAGLMDWHVVDLTIGTIVAQGNCESRPLKKTTALTAISISKTKRGVNDECRKPLY